MKTTLDLPDDLVRRIKIRAVQERKPLKRLVAELLHQSFNLPAASAAPAATPESESLTVNERGFPVIRCGPGAPASRMTVEEILALEQKTLIEGDLRRVGLSL